MGIRAPIFKGENFEEFEFKLKAYMKVVNYKFAGDFQIIQDVGRPFTDNDFVGEEETLQHSTLLTAILSSICEGPSMTFLRTIKSPHGFEIWCQFEAKYKRTSQISALARLTHQGRHGLLRAGRVQG